MNTSKLLIKFILFLIIFRQEGKAQTLYFPPITGNNWDTLSPQKLGWCNERIDTLYNFLEKANTKGFIILKDGKIVLEKYFGNFNSDSFHQWNSAGKSLMGFMYGQLQEQKLLNINDKTSDYLDTGWTSAPLLKENKIKIFHHLTLTTGLDEKGNADPDCTADTCLKYKVDAGTRWYYYNATYRILEDVLESATKQTINQYTKNNVLDAIGMKGFWYNNIFFSRVRDMARFGLLTLNKGVFDKTVLLSDTNYFNEMTNTSQSFNPSYGYLWWLNGKGSFIQPGYSFQIKKDLIPSAPKDLLCALGKNDQKIYVSQSRNLVVCRVGGAANQSVFALSSFDDELWQHINKLSCPTNIDNNIAFNNLLIDIKQINPNNIIINNPTLISVNITLYDGLGKIIFSSYFKSNNLIDIPTNGIKKGIYFLRVSNSNSFKIMKIKL